VVLSAASKLLVLNSLNRFLELSTSITNTTQPDGDQEEPWFLAPSFATETAYHNFIQIIQPLHCAQQLDSLPFLAWQDRTDASFSAPFFNVTERAQPWSTFDLDDAEGLLGSLDGTRTSDDYLSSLARSLQPTLISTFLDNAPAALISPSRSLIIETKLVHVVGRLARALYSPILRRSSLVGEELCGNADTLIPLVF
jgi:pre-rRNA-processing protein IPI1